MFELSSVDVHYAVKELSQYAGAKVEKVYQSDTNKRDVFFVLYLRDRPKLHLRFLLPGMVCTPLDKPSYPQLPPGFAMFLRKHLSGTRLERVEQKGFDRIIIITFASKTATFRLLIELFHPGNMLLIGEDDRIMNLLENQQYKDRVLRGRQPYVAPPSSFNLLAVSETELADRIVVSTKNSIVTTLAIGCGLGGVYAEEVCARAGIAKHRNDLSQAEVGAVAHIIKELLDLPILAHNDAERAYPFPMISKQMSPSKESSFLAALATTVIEEIPTAIVREVKKQPQNKLQAIIDAQRQQVTRFEEEAIAEQRKAEVLYEQYLLAQEIIAVAKEAREHKQDVRAALKRFPQCVGYKEATGEVELEIDDVTGDV